MAWKFAHIGFEGDGLQLGGVDVWKSKWVDAGVERAELPHPAYQHQIYRFDIYDIETANGHLRFAFTELSASVYGFYTWQPE